MAWVGLRLSRPGRGIPFASRRTSFRCVCVVLRCPGILDLCNLGARETLFSAAILGIFLRN